MNYYRVGDRLPAFEITVEDGGLTVDLTALTVYVRWERGNGTDIAERTATVTNAVGGVCQFVWQSGDLTVPGLYRAIVQLAPTATPSLRQSLAEPPLIEMEVLPNDFPDRDTSLSVMPTPGADDVALLLGQPANELDANQINAAIQRARRLTYVTAHIDRIGGALGGASLVILEDLVTQLAALMISQPPSAVYGPFQKESIGSYSYDLKKTSKTEPGVFFGVPQIDELIVYFRDLAKQQGDLIGVEYPEWWQPVTYRMDDPSRLGDLSL